MEDIVTLSDLNFKTEVLDSQIPVLVDFWAPWCGPCRAIAPVVEGVAKDYKGKLKVGKLNVDDFDALPMNYGVMSIPTLLVFKGGDLVSTIVGAVPKAKIELEIKKHL